MRLEGDRLNRYPRRISNMISGGLVTYAKEQKRNETCQVAKIERILNQGTNNSFQRFVLLARYTRSPSRRPHCSVSPFTEELHHLLPAEPVVPTEISFRVLLKPSNSFPSNVKSTSRNRRFGVSRTG